MKKISLAIKNTFSMCENRDTTVTPVAVPVAVGAVAGFLASIADQMMENNNRGRNLEMLNNFNELQVDPNGLTIQQLLSLKSKMV